MPFLIESLEPFETSHPIAVVALGFVFVLFEASCTNHIKNPQVLSYQTNGALLGFGNAQKPSLSALMKSERQ